MATNDECCPWCDHELRDLWDYQWDNDETIETECPSCGKDIVIVQHVSVDYEVKKPRLRAEKGTVDDMSVESLLREYARDSIDIFNALANATTPEERASARDMCVLMADKARRIVTVGQPVPAPPTRTEEPEKCPDCDGRTWANPALNRQQCIDPTCQWVAKPSAANQSVSVCECGRTVKINVEPCYRCGCVHAPTYNECPKPPTRTDEPEATPERMEYLASRLQAMAGMVEDRWPIYEAETLREAAEILRRIA